jgi:hypothetical protein
MGESHKVKHVLCRFFLKIEDCEGGYLTYRVIIQVNMVIINGELAGCGPNLFQVTLIAYSRMN